VFEMPRAVQLARRIAQRVGTTITIGEGDAVDLRPKGTESSLIRMGLTGHRKGQQRATVKGVFEADDGGTPGVAAGDLHGVLYSLGAAIHQQSLFGKATRRERVQALGHSDVTLVGSHAEGCMQETAGLVSHRINDRAGTMANVQGADATGEINEPV